MLPKKLFIYRENEGNEDEFLLCENTVEDCAKKGEVVLVGVYELKEQLEVTLEVKETVHIQSAA